MGCRQSCPEKRPVGGSTPRFSLRPSVSQAEQRPVLTPHQMELVKDTWQLARSDIARVGVITFMHLFEKYPDVQNTFVPYRGLSKVELQDSKKLREHGLKVLLGVEKAVYRVDKQDKLVDFLHDLGRKHLMLNVKPDYIDLVGAIIMDAIKPLVGDKWTEEVDVAWIDFFRLVSHIMKETMI